VSRAGWLVLVALLAAGACGGDDDGSGAGDAGTAVECPTDRAGPALVEVPSPDGSGYCIDATEVTSAQYQQFLDAQPVLDQPDRCGDNDTFEPLTEAQCDGAWDPAARPDFPASCIDWCDAWSYCAWAGKHLCGRIGGGPLGNDADLNEASASEWYNACSSGGKNDYAYGDSWEPETCNGGPEDFETTVPPAEVASFPGCVGTEPPFDQIFDMSGNVSEWIDACDDSGVAPYCWEAGGGSNSRSLTTCPASEFGPADDVWWDKGFRCCWEPDDGS
jgi:sulfatase modifying factor 1